MAKECGHTRGTIAASRGRNNRYARLGTLMRGSPPLRFTAIPKPT